MNREQTQKSMNTNLGFLSFFLSFLCVNFCVMFDVVSVFVVAIHGHVHDFYY